MNTPSPQQLEAHALFRFERIIKEKAQKADVGWLLILVSIGISALGAVGIGLLLTLVGAGLMLKDWLSGDDEVEHVLSLEMLEDIQVSGSSIEPHGYHYDDVLKVELRQPEQQKTLTLCLHSKDGEKWQVFSKSYALHDLVDFFQTQGLEVSEQGKYSAILIQPVSTERTI